MSLGPGFEIKNCTQWPMTVSLEQIGPLYHSLNQPGEIFIRDTGAVWFTIKAVVSPDNKDHISDWDCIIPVASIVGAVALAALTGGYGAYLAVAQSVGASALVAGGASMSLANVVIQSAGTAGINAAITVSTAVKLLGDAFARNGGASRWGCYAGPPWPFRDERKTYSIVGGPVASATSDGKLVISDGTPLQIVDGFQPLPHPVPPLNSWSLMPGQLVGMSMMWSGLMMGVNVQNQPLSWDGQTWSVVPGDRTNISAAADGTVWSVNTQKRLYRWQGPDWILHEQSDHVASVIAERQKGNSYQCECNRGASKREFLSITVNQIGIETARL